uniref:Uncharacterized protein n=1 Tax=Meloidogyne enterolobii TaxID=390850 RepID=A0A6V7UXM6_MELEN|nr:unnamed protein product [Meloidogyne enterolobii]
MLKNFIKINLLLFIFIITKNDGMDPEKDTIEYFLRGSGAFGTTNSLIQEEIQNNPNAEINSTTPMQTNHPHPSLYNQNIQPPQFNPNFHHSQSQNMFSSSSSTNHFPPHFQYSSGYYPKTQHFIPTHLTYFGDSSNSGTVQNFQENFPLNPGYNSFYQASSSSFKGTTSMLENLNYIF